MKTLSLSALLIIVSHFAFAQHSSLAYQKLADSLFEHHNYQSAATYYEKAIKKSEQPGNIMLQLAKCNGKMNRVSEAEQWYKKAKDNHATFKNQDTYDFVQILLALQKQHEAEALLQELLRIDPNALHARKLLDDIEHVEKYYQDTTAYSVLPLPINTLEAEFAPAYYKDGIVFSSAQPQSFSKTKYHWDNGDFLNLYYSKSINNQLQKPELFEKELDSRFHDGPAAFYNNSERMIVNRNRAVQAAGKKDTWIWHLSLYDAQQSKANGTWELTSLPFDEPPYSLAHPSISEDGNVLYFVSDKPGGYGGMDIYRTAKVNGIWIKPFNLGPTVNTPGNEVFPFFTGNTLYFASNGHGGLGGLDIFKSSSTINGFTPPVNLGYPINSSADDFSFITKGEIQNGYFSSSRNGNDDLFSFHKQSELVKMLAYAYDGVTKEPLPGAAIQLMTSSNEDKELTSDENGYIRFELSKESAYVLIGNKDGKTGMVTGFSLPEEDHQHLTHQIPLFGDTTKIVCIGTIADEFGIAQNATSIKIIDETTGKEITHDKEKSLINFMGEKGHSYRIEIENQQGEVTVQQFSIQADETGTKTWHMVLKKSTVMMSMAARVFNAENNESLGEATVKIITFSEPDQELVANSEGVVEFTLTEGTAYVVVGSKDNLTGMHAGVAERGTDKASVIHPVPAHGDPIDPLPVVALVTDSEGEILPEANVIVTDKSTGESVPAEVTDGVLSFLGEREKEYDIKVTSSGYDTILDELSIPKEATTVDKVFFALEKEPLAVPVSYLMAARIFKEDDQSPLAGAEVTITSFTEPDKELIANEEGLIDFTLTDGSAFIILATKDGYNGMYSGVTEKGTDKASIIHPVPTNLKPEKQVTVLAKVSDEQSSKLTSDNFVVTEKSSGEVIPAQLSNGILSFNGDTQETYTITLNEKDYNRTIVQEVSIPVETNQIKKISLSLPVNKVLKSEDPTTLSSTDNEVETRLPMVGKITNTNGEVLNNAIVVVTDKSTGETIPAQYKDGLISFFGEKGKTYSISVSAENHQSKTQDISIPADATTPGKISITLEGNKLPSYQMAASVFKEEDKTALAGAHVIVTSFTEPDLELTADTEGMIEFSLPEGCAYIVLANKDGYHGMHTGMAEKGMDKLSHIHPVPTNKEHEKQIPVVAQLSSDSTLPMNESDVTVAAKSTGKIVPAQLSNGVLSFYGDKGESYAITIGDQDQSRVEEISIAEDANEIQKVSFVEKDEPQSEVIESGLAVQVFKAEDQSPLSNANVKIISFSESDQELTTNADGKAYFNLPENTPFIAISSTDGYTGMYTGNVESGENIKITHPVSSYAIEQNQLPVVGIARGKDGGQLIDTHVKIINNTTGQEVTVQNQNGFLSFIGEKGNTYTIQISAEDHETITQEITVEETATVAKTFEVNLPSSESNMPVNATMIILNADGNTSRFYISTNDSHIEIFEREGNLYAQNGAEEKLLGQGSLVKLKANPSSYLKELGLSFDDMITLQNIYFDFNKASLDKDDKKELDKAKVILQRYPSLQLTIGAHADDRGGDRYNLNLSKRRAKSIESYLVKNGVKTDHMYIMAYGESEPAIPCPKDCDEEDHRKNRRAEFTLRTTKKTEESIVISKVKVKALPKLVSSSHKEFFEKYGDKEVEGLSFKVNIGAYRFNHTLTFDNLKDLGIVEKDHVNGITYYYLSSYKTLKSVDDIRAQVIKRGVKDAFVSIFYQGEKVSFSTFRSLVEK